ncbi:hypothetical protein DUNSADRAFT_1907 [Dunaliella salina]|uniref:tRNA/rRNA methyltransferase SpoU type domain-containing protein n=1 Tax=Dunaliella salina TaxID=3046 RepID=A0ABQ7GWU7_DUNSA|nr:hypothetical protein DUNSADRAFT_1907 [Dunaliella salina]|eukprot:KAF5838962.1 hypothetical protein DUNSADRAFT_1907 [Dunaliella salina]
MGNSLSWQACLFCLFRTARCSAFEVDDMRIVAPRCSHLSRHALGPSKGAQYVLHNARTHDTITEATSDCDLTVAFTRWVKGQGLPFYDLAALMEHPLVKALVSADAYVSKGSADDDRDRNHLSNTGIEGSSSSSSTTNTNTNTSSNSSTCGGSSGAVSDEDRDEGSGGNGNGHSANSSSSSNSSSSNSCSIDGVNTAGVLSADHKKAEGKSPSNAAASSQRSVRVALVFGREDLGMSDEEVQGCDVICSIPIGRLQESLSLSHAVSISLSSLFQRRTEELSRS